MEQSIGSKNNEKFFNLNMEIFTSQKEDFKVVSSGSRKKIIKNDEVVYESFNPDYIMKGAHLIRLFKKQVKKIVESGSYVPTETDNERYWINTVMYDPENIKKNFKTGGFFIDIDHCYWRTAYIMGLMDDNLYNTGIKKRQEYKLARCAAIGALGKCHFETYYQKGEKIGDRAIIEEYNVVRLDIIDYVWNMAKHIAKQLQKEGYFYMFLTDCFFVTGKGSIKCTQLIKRYGYDFAIEPFNFNSIENIGEGQHRIEWKKDLDEEDKSMVFNVLNKI